MIPDTLTLPWKVLIFAIWILGTWRVTCENLKSRPVKRKRQLWIGAVVFGISAAPLLFIASPVALFSFVAMFAGILTMLRSESTTS